MPSDHAYVAAVHGIAKHAFNGVLAKEKEEESGFDFAQSLVLRSGSEEMKALEALQTVAVNLPWRSAALIAEFACSVFKGRLRVTKAIPAIGTRKLTINEDSHAGFSRAGARIVRREDARGRSRNDESFRFGEKAERNSHRLMLCGEKRGFAVKRINEDAPESSGRKREKMTAAHVRSVTEESRRGTRGGGAPHPWYK